MVRDLRHAVRLLARSPGFTLAAVLTLALGIAMTSAIFSIVDAVLLRPVPFPDSERLVMVWETDRDTGTSHEPGSWPDFVDFRDRSRRLEALAGVIPDEATLTPANGEPARLAAAIVTRELLPMLGVSPSLGRAFEEGDEQLGGESVVLISERLRQRLFADGAPVIGQTLRLDDRPRTIVGVVPSNADFGLMQVLSAADYGRGFVDRDARSRVDVWIPLQANPQELVRDTHPLLMLGRLAPGASHDAAQDEMAAIAADLERTYPSNRSRGVSLEPLDRVIFGPTEPALLVLMTAVGLVLLIACVNVANLLLARATTRRREVAVRSAVGAGTYHIARQFLVEALVLTFVAGLVGCAAAAAAVQVLVVTAPPEVPRLSLAAIDMRALLLTLGVSLIVGTLFGLVPLVQAWRADLLSALNADSARGASAGRGGRLARSTLVVAEVALAVVLVIGSGLLIKSFWRLQSVDPGFDASGVLKAEFQLPASRYPVDFRRWPDAPEVRRFNTLLLARTASLPNVEGAALATSHPLDAGFTNSFTIIGREAESRDLPEISVRQVTPGYFPTLHVALVEGRLLDESDGTQAPAVAVINEAAVRRLFPKGDPVGQQIAFWGTRRTIVGVVADEKFHGLAAASPMAAYVPIAQAPSRGGNESLLIRTSGDPAALASSVRRAIAEVDPALAVFGLEPLARTLDDSVGTERVLMLLVGVFALAALALAAIGIHGVLSCAVSERTREIGIRIALGASPKSVTRMVVNQGLRLTAGGLVAGLVLGLALAQALAGLLFGVRPTDAVTLVVVLAVLGAVAMLSTWLPVRRAARVDPVVALRD